MFNTLALPIFFHPTNVMLVDDDKTLLNNLSMKIDEKFPFVLFSDPNEALDYLESHSIQTDGLSSKIIVENNEQPISDAYCEIFNVNLEALQNNIDSPERFKCIVVLIVDYNMPKMTGDKFCRIIRQKKIPVKLILLTGVAGNKEAVTAFNENIIDAYLSKDDPNLFDKLNSYINNLAYACFQEISSQLLGMVRYKLRILENKNLINIFEEICLENKIVEFYLTNTSGYYLLFNAKGEAKNLVILNDEDFENAYEFAKDSKASNGVLQRLADRQQYPDCTLDRTAYLKYTATMWEENLVCVSKIPKNGLYYFLSNRKIDNVFSFNKYQSKIWPQP